MVRRTANNPYPIGTSDLPSTICPRTSYSTKDRALPHGHKKHDMNFNIGLKEATNRTNLNTGLKVGKRWGKWTHTVKICRTTRTLA